VGVLSGVFHVLAFSPSLSSVELRLVLVYILLLALLSVSDGWHGLAASARPTCVFLRVVWDILLASILL